MHSQDDINAFANDLRQAADERGVQLSNEQAQDIYDRTVSINAFTPAGTRHVLGEVLQEMAAQDQAIAEFESEEQLYGYVDQAAQDLAKQIRRPLLDTERARLHAAAEPNWQTISHMGVDADPTIAVRDQIAGSLKPVSEMTRAEANAWQAQRLSEMFAEPDPQEREYDMDNRSDVNAYMAARMNGMPAMEVHEVWDED